jgi:hypothetical protein
MGFKTLNGTLQADPSGSGNATVLTFFLPATVGNGDVSIFDGSLTGPLDDVIRFTDAQGRLTGFSADRMLYYSDNTDADPAGVLADTASPPINRQTSGPNVVELGPEGNTGFVYTIPSDNLYIGTSDGVVPEPGSLSLLGTGLIGLAGFVRRKFRKLQ